MPEVIEATAARMTLAFCEDCLHRLETDPKGNDWFFAWVSALALLRAVGHALKNRDSVSNQLISDANTSLHREVMSNKDKHSIFHGFIVEFRNNLLKELEVGATYFTTDWPDGTETDHFILTHGAYAGKDQREVIRDAVHWWRWYINEVECRAAGAKIEVLLPDHT